MKLEGVPIINIDAAARKRQRYSMSIAALDVKLRLLSKVLHCRGAPLALALNPLFPFPVFGSKLYLPTSHICQYRCVFVAK